jgi:hypothetical protein
VYPISIFRFEIILTLITAGKFTQAVMLCPMTLLLNSVRVDLFSRKTRKDLLHRCFYLIKLMMEQKQHRRGRKRILLKTGERGDFVMSLQEEAGIRILNTIIVFPCSLEKFEDIALDRLSSHPLENVFGFRRHSVHDVNTFRQMLIATAKSTIVKAAQKKTRFGDRIPKRANNSGVKIYKSEETSSRSEQKIIHFTLPETVTDLSAMASILLHHGASDALLIRSTFPRESQRFSPYFDSRASLYAVTTMNNTRNEPNIRFITTSGQRIMALLRGYDQKESAPLLSRKALHMPWNYHLEESRWLGEK